ncbi:hypothetical protein ACS0TY_013902 [Phlomoides rotata]
MANQENLVKIGEEGFCMLEDLYGQAKMLESLPQPQNAGLTKNRKKSATPRTIDCNQAAKKYGGVVIMDVKTEYRI